MSAITTRAHVVDKQRRGYKKIKTTHMDPNIWGPVVWATIIDVSWTICQLSDKTKHLKTAVSLFFQSLQFLLPCRFCRESYVVFLAELGGGPPFVREDKCDKQSTLKWTYDLKNKVNKKLEVKDVPPFEKIEQRLKTWNSVGSTTAVMDMLFIMAENYDADLDTDIDTRLNKQVWFFILVRCLTELAAYMPALSYSALYHVFAARPVALADVASKKAIMSYLCSQYSRIARYTNASGAGVFDTESACRKYSNARPLSKKH